MKKALIIVPHLSTGGSCQFALNKIKMLVQLGIGIYVIEYNFFSPDFVVQRNQIIEIIDKQHIGIFFSYDTGEGYHTLKGRADKSTTYQADIELIQPDFIFLEENPKMFMDEKLMHFIYNYGAKVFETTHDSSFGINTDNNSFKTFVSPYSALQYLEAGGDLDKYTIIEDPIDGTWLKRQISSFRKNRCILDFAPDKKHVIIVGLFTPRKNQAYAIEIARQLTKYPILFHFIGNMAENFRHYWQPLVDNLPSNCILHGEKDNVHDYILAADLFLFTSEGNPNDKELNPLVIREAMRKRCLPKLIFNLDVYLKRYDNATNMHFLSGDIKTDVEQLKSLVKIQSMYNNPHTPQPQLEIIGNNGETSDVLIVIGAYPNNPHREKLTLQCIEKVKPLGYDIAIASHHSISKEIEAEVDVVLYDKYNPITTHSYYKKFWSDTPDYYAEINLADKPLNQSLCVLNNIKNGLGYAHANLYKAVMYINYDILVDERDFHAIQTQIARVAIPADNPNHCHLVACLRDTTAGKGYETTCMFFNPIISLAFAGIPKDPEGYNDFAKKIGAENYLEHFMHRFFENYCKNTGLKVHEITNEANTILEHTGLGTQSCSEYVALLPIEGDEENVCLYSFSNNRDNRNKWFYLKNNMGKATVIMKHDLLLSNSCMVILNKKEITNTENIPYIIHYEEYEDGSFSNEMKISTIIIYSSLIHKNGIFRFKKKEEAKPEREAEMIISESVYDAETKPAPISDMQIIAEALEQKKPRIRLVHLFLKESQILDTVCTVQRNSKRVLEKVTDHGWHYVPVYNDLYASTPPIHNCNRPNDVVPFGTQRTERSLTSYHYGCYDSFKTAVLGYLDNDIDLLIVCEGDCKLEVPLEEFVSFVENNIKALNENRVAIVSYGDKNALETGVLQSHKINQINEHLYTATKIIGLQCIGFLPKRKHEIFKLFMYYKWDAMDILINDLFNPFSILAGNLAIVEKRLTSQYDGFSLIEQRVKKFL